MEEVYAKWGAAKTKVDPPFPLQTVTRMMATRAGVGADAIGAPPPPPLQGPVKGLVTPASVEITNGGGGLGR